MSPPEFLVSGFLVLSFLLACLGIVLPVAWNRTIEYSEYSTRIRVLIASEVLMTSADKGLAVYDQNTVMHHVISREKLEGLRGMAPEELGKRLGLKRAWIDPARRMGECVTRIGVLDGEQEVIRLCGE